MFSVYIVFGRRRVRLGDAKAADKGEIVTVLDSWVPDSKPGEGVDDRLEAEGLPKTARLAEFCFAKRKIIDDAAGLVPPALSFIFTLTSSSGERTHCYCLRAHRPDDTVSHRLDVGGDWIEASVFVSKFPYHKLFPAALNICRVRRTLDRPSHLAFLQQLHRSIGTIGPVSPSPNASSTGTKGSLVVDSPCMNVSCRFEFSLKKEPKLDCIFDTMNPQVLQYVLGAILLERRVCLVAKHEKRLSDVAYALTHLACGEAPLKGYCHNFVPVLPGTMLELGLGNPAPYIVGILRIHLKATDAIKELGDIVIVDLDSKVVRISPGGSPILPLGIDIVSDNGLQPRKEGGDLYPWLDVCTPFQRDLNTAFANRDVDSLSASVRAVLLIVTVGRVGTHLEDPAMRSFNSHFKKTQIAAAAQPANDSAIAVILGNRGYPGLKAQLTAQQAASQGPEKMTLAQAIASVVEITGTSGSKGRSDLVTKNTVEIAKRTYDAYAFQEGIDNAIKSRFGDCQGRNWKYAYKTLGLLNLLLRTGSELVVASCWDDLGTIFDLTRFSLNGVMGVPSRVADLVQKRAAEVYSLVVDIHALTFARSFNGHIMFQRATRQKMQASVTRIPLGRDLKSLLDICAPSPVVEPDFNDDDGKASQVSSTTGMIRPPPPPPVPLPASSPNVLVAAAPPPPPPIQPKVTEGLLLDLDFSGTSSSSNSADQQGDPFILPRTPIVTESKSVSPPKSPKQTYSQSSKPAVTKLITAFEPKQPSGRADAKLITTFDAPEPKQQDRPRRPRTEDTQNHSNGGGSPPARPNRLVPTKSVGAVWPPVPHTTTTTEEPPSLSIPPTASNHANFVKSPLQVSSPSSPRTPPGITSRWPPAAAKESDGEGTHGGLDGRPKAPGLLPQQPKASNAGKSRGPPPPGIKG